MDKLDHEQLAWAAGFIDGEGSFTLHTTHGRPTDKRKYGSPKLEVAQVDRRVLDKLQQILGCGKVRGPYSQRKVNQNDYFRYQLTGFESTQAVIAMVWPWLGPVKREQAENALLAYHKLYNRSPLPKGPTPKLRSVNV